MTVIPMAAPHIEAVAGLEATCFADPWSVASLSQELENPLAVFRVAVNSAGQVVGYIGMHHLLDEGFITNVAVSPAVRRQGVARALLEDLITYGEAHGLVRITLEVRTGNRPAIALYEGLGFVCDGVRPRFYRHPDEDAAIYSLYF